MRLFWDVVTLLLIGFAILGLWKTSELIADLIMGRVPVWWWRRRFRVGELVCFSEKSDEWIWQIVAANDDGVVLETLDEQLEPSRLNPLSYERRKLRRSRSWAELRREGMWRVPAENEMERRL